MSWEREPCDESHGPESREDVPARRRRHSHPEEREEYQDADCYEEYLTPSQIFMVFHTPDCIRGGMGAGRESVLPISRSASAMPIARFPLALPQPSGVAGPVSAFRSAI